jgi:hypothetical protein
MDMPTPKITLSISGATAADVTRAWKQMAWHCDYFGRNSEGNISALIVAIALLPEQDRRLLQEFLKKLLPP